MTTGQRVGPSEKARTKEPKERRGDWPSINVRIAPHIMEMLIRCETATGKKKPEIVGIALFEYLTKCGYHNPAKINDYKVRKPSEQSK